MNKKVYIIHRWAGNPEADFYPWLKTVLEKEGFEVIVPAMPDTFTPKLESWVPRMSEMISNADENTYFIGHSIGCQTILRYLDTVSNPVGGVVLVAPWFELKGLESDEEKEVAKPWIETPISFDKVKLVAPKLTALFSKGDQFVEVEPNKKVIEEKLGGKALVLGEKYGHFTEDEGITKLTELLESLLNLVIK